MPGWYANTKELRESGKLAFVGLIQEQHPDRCALFLQWQQIEMPILVDSLNRTGVHAVPLYWAIDEHGVLQKTRPSLEWLRDEFVETEYPAPAKPSALPAGLNAGTKAFLEGDAAKAVFIWEAQMASEDPGVNGVNAQSLFRLGAAYRARFDSAEGLPSDFQRAVELWTAALELAPQNYIYRRRIQQYGPLLGKPYPFYDWIAQARSDIKARGETPHALVVEPGLTESLGKSNPIAASFTKEPDPQGKLPRDAGLVDLEVTVVPWPVKPGEPARVHLSFTPSIEHKAHWDNDAGGSPEVWLKLPTSWEASPVRLAHDAPSTGLTSDTRVYEFELQVPKEMQPMTLGGYATYGVCEDKSGSCRFLRKDLEIPIRFF